MIGAMDHLRTIGELAREAGIPVSTVRYYERTGLLRPAERTESNYRLYGTEEADRLRFIRAAQATGFTLADIQALLQHKDGVIPPCRDVRLLIQSRLAQVRDRMSELRHIQKVLGAYLDDCSGVEADEPCPVIDKLDPAERKPLQDKGSRPRGRKGKRSP